MSKSIENLNTVFDSFYKFVVGIGLFIMVTPYILLWFFTYMHSKVNEVSNFTINNYGYITATSSEISLYSNFYYKYINYFCGLPLILIEVFGIFVIIFGCINWYNKEQKHKDYKMLMESIQTKNNLIRFESTDDDKKKNDEEEQKTNLKNIKNANSNLDFRNKEQKNKLLERIRVLNSFRKKIFLHYNDDIDYYVLRNIRFDIMNNKSYICDILAISKTNKSDIICDVKFYSHLENHLYNLVEKYNSVIQKYYSMHKRTCKIRLVFIVKNDEFNNIDSTEINSKIKVLCGTSGIIAEFHNENELMEV